MKLLTFLGVGRYETTEYIWNEQSHVSNFAPAATCRFLKPETLIIFLTEDAQQQVFQEFRQALPDGLQVVPIPIPLGSDTQQLWQIFEQVSGAVQPGETVAFDITHGLRSFPLVGLLAAAFLRSGLSVDLQAVLYGAFDVRDKSVTPNRTPMFDLSPMLTLLEWSTAADRFNRTGDSRYLASLVTRQRKQLAQMAGGDPRLLEQVGYLGNLAGALSNISQSLHLIRPYQVMESVAQLPERTGKAKAALETATAARPFDMVLEGVVQSYLPLAQPSPLDPGCLSETLRVERVMIHWYARRELWVQAVSLAREWMLSWVMLRLGLTNFTQLASRQRVESVLGAEANDLINAKQNKLQFSPMFFTNLPDIELILNLWSNLTRVRNDIDHAGMREDPGKPEDLIKQIETCIDQLDLLLIE